MRRRRAGATAQDFGKGEQRLLGARPREIITLTLILILTLALTLTLTLALTLALTLTLTLALTLTLTLALALILALALGDELHGGPRPRKTDRPRQPLHGV